MVMPPDTLQFAAIVVAAGRGERAGMTGEGPKQYRSIGGRAVISRTIQNLTQALDLTALVVVIHADDEALFEEAVRDLSIDPLTVFGGTTRQQSVAAGLNYLMSLPSAPSHVLIHDAVRPFVDRPLIDRLTEPFARGWKGGTIPGLPIVDTIKRADDRAHVEETLDRKRTYTVQTPQCFPLAPLHLAHKSAASRDGTFTDDAAIAEWSGMEVRIVTGSAHNTKLTFPQDLKMADARLSERRNAFPDVRVGNGYDVHQCVSGDAVILCGTSIPARIRLTGHSDADVGWHALTDALLATCSAGDIGTHFPPSDEQWKGAASKLFLQHAATLVSDKGGRIANVDITLICEEPKIAPHRQRMLTETAKVLGIEPSRVSIKATTNETIGFIGRGEGIAAIATASVVYQGSIE